MFRQLLLSTCAAAAIAPAVAAPAPAPGSAGIGVRAAPAGLGVVDAAAPAGIAQTVRTWESSSADVDGDGVADLLLNLHNSDAGAVLYSGRTDGRYVPVARFGERDRHGCTYADVDGDARLDVYCTMGAGNGTAPPKKNELYLQPAGGFVGDIPFTRNVSLRWGVADPLGRGRHARFLNLDHDGRPDLFVGNSAAGPTAPRA